MSGPIAVDQGEPRPGSRAERMSRPRAADALRAVAERNGVCVRPIVLRRIDTATGQTEIVEVPCGARLAAKCKPCAERGRRLRIQQIREGWHLDTEPTVTPGPPDDEALALVRYRAHLEFERCEAERAAKWDDVTDLDDAIEETERLLTTANLRGRLTPDSRTPAPRKVRSTRRRQDSPDLPRLAVEARTIGRVYTGRAGRTHRPSMLLTLTLPSHGPVHTANRRGPHTMPCACGQLHGPRDDILGTPLDPATYDYRAAALDAIHFARLTDRFWQNLRRAVGYQVQYAGAVELQRRLAPHGHYAVRGTVPRRLLKQVAAATYHHVWWPAFDRPVYTVDRPPVWNADLGAYVDPRTGTPLPSWAEALSALDAADAEPAYLAKLGTIDPREIKGVEAGTREAERCIRYVTKYITKSLTDPTTPRGDHARAHFDRLHAELATLPCSPTCANWLLYGVAPDEAKPGLTAGRCGGKVHQRETLGFTGRRVLISRNWSGKTLRDHRADNRAWLHAILAGQLADDGQGDNDSTDPAGVRYRFEHARPDDPDVPALQHRLLRAISARITWRNAIARARDGDPAPVPATQDRQIAA